MTWRELNERIEGHDAAMFQLGWVADLPDPDSFLRTLFESGGSANYFDFSDEEIGRALEGKLATEDPALQPLLRVHSGTERPADAFVTIRYREHWFWIEDRDLNSKGISSFLMFLFTLSETGGGGQVLPVITVPAG